MNVVGGGGLNSRESPTLKGLSPWTEGRGMGSSGLTKRNRKGESWGVQNRNSSGEKGRKERNQTLWKIKQYIEIILRGEGSEGKEGD